MNWLIHFLRDNTEPLCLISGVFILMLVFVCAIAIGMYDAGNKKGE